jgi:transposase, IS5 family
MMFKILLLQSWYQLSDPAMEKQLARDLLFRRFVGLGLDAPLPDYSTLWRFRELLIKKRLLDRLFERVNHQLSNSGALIQSGSISIVDATVIEAKQSRPKKNKSGQSTQDP